MKKKLVGFIVLALSTIFLVACSNNSLDGKYYKVYDGEKKLAMEIKGDSGFVNFDGKKVITKIDKDSKTISYEDYGNRLIKYEITKDGKFSYFGDIAGKGDFYKENSQALKKALKE
ncbi:TPA: hypothetical protein U5Y67_000071 [Streptococcus agalactiae]|nr:hypothetical protein [Streptococcus agalactiae]HEN4303128.1 hypothetical protein [Streptococcus agalactiae]